MSEPTVHELQQILDEPDGQSVIEVQPDGSVAAVSSLEGRPVESVVKMLERWAAAAKDGKIQAVAMVALREGGNVRTGVAGFDTTRSELLLLGALRTLDHDVLVDQEREFIEEDD